MRARVSVEAGVAMSWHQFVGDAGRCVSLEHFGASADFTILYREFGITVDAVVAAARESLDRRTSLTERSPAVTTTTGTSDNVRTLAAQGVSVWLDDLSRARLASGDLAGARRPAASSG